jgi:hypothetical protein
MWGKTMSSGRPADRDAVDLMMIDWQTESGLSLVRDDVGLGRLPAAEQLAWREFWRDVKALLERARATAGVQPAASPGK